MDTLEELSHLSLSANNDDREEDEAEPSSIDDDENEEQEEPEEGEAERSSSDENEEQEEPNTDHEEGKSTEWRKSKARAYLFGLLVDGKLPGRDEITPKQVFDNYCKDRPEFNHFQDYTALKFASKLMYLRNTTKTKSDRSQVDAAALARDRLIFPSPLEDTKGRPMWQGSEAQKLLIQDIKNGRHKAMKPKLLYESRDKYHEDYDQDFFRERIYKEVKALKREAWVKAKAEKKKKKK